LKIISNEGKDFYFCRTLLIIRYLVSNVELTIVDDKDKFIELNKNLDREIIHFNYLKESIEIIAYEKIHIFENILFYNIEQNFN
jgi:hypothetical protein